MSILLKKAWQDLVLRPGRSLLVLVALISGLWGVGSVLVTYSILHDDLTQNYLRTNPSHAVLTFDAGSALDLQAFRGRPEIAAAEFRDLSLQRVEVLPDRWLPLWLFGVADLNHVELAHFYPQAGAFAPGALLIERNGLQVSNLALGATARIRVGARMLSVPVSGLVFDPAQAPATQDAFIYAYVDQPTYTSLTGEQPNRRLLVRFRNVENREQVVAATDRLVAELRAQGLVVTTLNVPKFNEHPHQFQLNTLIALQGLIGLLAFMMGAVLVSQLMSALLAQQIRQIGIMKAIGASRRQVMTPYLALVLILAAVSSAIALPLAVLSGYGYAGFVARQLNFEILTTSLPLWSSLVLLAMGLGWPVLLALRPLLQGTSASVLQALASYGLESSATGATPGWSPGGPALLLPLRNTLRRRGRLAVTVTTMMLGVAIFSTGFNIRQALVNFLDRTRTAIKYDVQVVFKDEIPLETALAPFQAVPNVARVDAWNGGRGRLQSDRVFSSNGIGVVALPAQTDLVSWDVIAGRWLQAGQEAEFVLNQGASELLGHPVVGKRYPLQLKGQVFEATLVGVIKEFDQPKIYLDQAWYDATVNPEGRVNSLLFLARDNSYDAVLELKQALERALAGSELQILYVMSQAERGQIIYDHLDIILSLLISLSLLVLIVGALGMASATGINILERTREIGVMRAIGATPRAIYRLFVVEGLLVSGASIVLGLLLAWPLSSAASAFFGDLILGDGVPLGFAFSWPGLLVTLCVTFGFGWLASRVPARRAVAVEAREALVYE